MIVLAVLGVAAGALSRIATRQQRNYRALATRSLALGQLREGSDVLASELAGLSPGAGDIYEDEMRDASIGFRAVLGSYLLCGPPPVGSSEIDVIRLSPTVSGGGPGGESAAARPAAGDSLWVHDAGVDIGGSEDGWSAHLITSAATARGSCPPASHGGGVELTRLTIIPAPRRSIAPYAPARLFRRARYTLYRSSDAGWYLGFSDCRPLVRRPVCAPMQPVSGPYLAYSPARATRPGGLTLDYLDRDGTPTGDRLAVAAIEVTLRAAVPTADGRPDTAVFGRVIALRNAPR